MILFFKDAKIKTYCCIFLTDRPNVDYIIVIMLSFRKCDVMEKTEENKNMEKYEAYKSMKVNLTKAMNSGFYYEAIFIEYAIIEDRCLSLLQSAEVKVVDNRGHTIKLSTKINKFRTHKAFVFPFIRKKLTADFLDELENWKRDRDALIHDLANIPYDPESVKSIAEHGKEIVRQLDNKVKSIQRYIKKENEKLPCQR